VGEPVDVERFGPHLGAVAGPRWRQVAGGADSERVDKVLWQVVDVPAHPVLERGANRYVVEDREVLDVLTQTHPTGVRADRNAELSGEDQHCQDLVDSTEAAAVDLTEVDCPRLQELLEHHPVLHVFASRDSYRCDRLADALVPEYVVRA